MAMIRTLFCVLVLSAAAAANEVPAYRIETVAGTGEAGFSGDGGPAVEAQLNRPTAVALDSVGNLYVADFLNNRVRMVMTDGIIYTVVGTGDWKSQDAALPANQTNIVQPYGIAVGPDNSLYVLSRGHNKIFRVKSDGMARLFAGSGRGGYAGDDGPATEARLRNSNHLVALADGTVYIADSGNAVVREVSPDGIMTTVAGTGEAGFSGDGGPATRAKMTGFSAIASDENGNLYGADFGNHRIRKIASDGTITTLAGTGEPDFNGDGMPATEANIGEPTGIAVLPSGELVIADQVNNRIRLVDNEGVMHTIAGIGKVGYTGDGGPGTEARIFIPDILCAGADGVIYFPDHQNNAVRKLVPAN